MSEALEQVQSLIHDDPKVHDWGSGPTSGGMSGDILATLAQYLVEFGEGVFQSVETGAGLSTLIFAAAKPGRHTVINPDIGLQDRIKAEATKRSISLDRVHYRTELSEFVLPELAKSDIVDLVLIDGGHGWPTVFVDFCYANMMLRQGGIMIVDDILLYPCTQLYLLLKHQPGWTLEKVVYAKTAFFRKETAARLLPDFGGQPFLVNNIILN